MNLGVDRTLGVVAASPFGVIPLRSVPGLDPQYAHASTLNPLLARDRSTWTELCERLEAFDPEPVLVPRQALALRLPFDVGDYVDFYASIHHATNLGRILRPGSEPLLPNWRHLPVSYHGRAGTVVVSGTPVRRPSGLVLTDEGPRYRPSARLDLELEVGVVVGGDTVRGEAMPIDQAGEHIFGIVLLNDWSARDIQAYEYQPLGPHLGKSFATSISAWVTPIDDLVAARVAPPAQDPPPSNHLQTDEPWALDLELRMLLSSKQMRVNAVAPIEVSATNFASLYWTVAQQLAHLTSNGASVRPGDLFGSGTVSGPDPGTEGSLIELTWNGERPLRLPDGTTRTFLEDGDRVILEGSAGDVRLGAVEGEILPAAT